MNRFRPSLNVLEARWVPDGTGDAPPDDPLGTTDPGTVGGETGGTDTGGDTWYGDQDPPTGGGDGGGDPPPGDPGDLGDYLDDNPGGGTGGPYVGP